MKSRTLALVALCVSSSAIAQSSLVLYGRLDAGLEYVSGLSNGAGSSASRLKVEGGNWGTSLWGFKGAEDLGGGTKAIFQLESGFSAINGVASGGTDIFNRWAYVGFSNDWYGTLTFGRQLWLSNGVWDFDPFGQSRWSTASLVRGRNGLALSNVIAYQSVPIHGVDFYGQYALSNGTNWNANPTGGQGRGAGLQATYTTAIFQVRGIYDESRDPTTGTFTNPFTASREYTAEANLFLGPFKVSAAYQAIRTSDATALGIPSTLDHIWGGVRWQATPAATLISAVYHVNANKGQGNATVYTVGGAYNLSKATFLDIQIATIHNSKTANFGLQKNVAGPGGPASDGTFNDNPIVGHGETGVYAGIQHSF